VLDEARIIVLFLQIVTELLFSYTFPLWLTVVVSPSIYLQFADSIKQDFLRTTSSACDVLSTKLG